MPKNILEFIQKIDQNEAEKTAISYYDGCNWHYLTYATLKQCAEQVATFLQNKPITGNKYILLCVDVTYTFPSLILGILKCGLGWCCLEADSSSELETFIQKLGVQYAFTNWPDERFVGLFPEFVLEDSFNLLGEKITILSSNNATDGNSADSKMGFMYAMQTSGSTGGPKIVEVPFSCIEPNIKDLSRIFQITKDDVVLLSSPVTFDPSVVELFLSLLNGSSLCIINRSVRNDPQRLLDVVFPPSGGLVSLLQTTPSLFRRWTLSQIRTRIFNDRTALRTLILGGEVFPAQDEFLSWSVPRSVSVFNIYGVTEVSCWSSVHQVWPTATSLDPHIGQPLSETILELRSEDGQLIIGSKTRICCVDGEKEDTLQGENIVFRSTGDIFKNVDNKLYFVERKDNLIKRWGTRVSLTDIEKISLLFDNILSSVCISAGDKFVRIGLFVIEKNLTDLTDFKSFLSKKLPKNSWPDVITNLESFPLSLHGKICRKSLARLMTDIERRTEVGEKRVDMFHRLWCHYTGSGTTGLSEERDFISAGGSSLTALQLTSQMNALHGTRLYDSIVGLLLGKVPYRQIVEHIDNKLGKEEKEVTLSTTDASHPETSQAVNNSWKSKYRESGVVKTILKGVITEMGDSAADDCSYTEKCNCLANCSLEESWKYHLGKCVDASPLGVLLKRGRHRELVIVGSHSGRVAVLFAPTGQLLSECLLPDRIEASACLSLCGQHYYIGCYDGCMYCISVEDGTIVWKFQTGDTIKSTCTLYKNRIMFGSYDKYLYCLHDNGTLHWKVDLKWAMICQILVEEGRLFCPTFGGLTLLNGQDGSRLWHLDSSPIFSNPIVQDDWVVMAEVTGSVGWINKHNGKKDCVFKAVGMIYCSLVKLRTADVELILFGCTEGWLYCLKKESMAVQLHWKVCLSAQLIATPLILSQLTLAATSPGNLCLISSTDGTLLSQYKLPGEVFSSPILFGNIVIVGCRDDHVYCLKILF